jgi:3-phosphoshikimate 1-carboxyvinyltransferase
MNSSIKVPGSKSLTNRALLVASLAKGTSVLNNVLLSDDTHVMIKALQKLGVDIGIKENTLTITSSGSFQPPSSPLILGNAGTAVRFLTAILAHQSFSSTIDGDNRMKERPLKNLIDALTELGAQINCPTGCPPLTINGGQLTGEKVNISGHQSSQYISALLMLGPLLPQGLILTISDELTSKPYVDLTTQLMSQFGIKGIRNNRHHSFEILPQKYTPQTINIEADASSATYFFGIAALTGKTITVSNLTRKTVQPDIKILKALEQMGCTITETEKDITLTGPSTLQALGKHDANDFPDGAMTLAVIAAFAEGTTTLTGLHNLKLKESDRLTALSTELKKIGALVSITDDSITIEGNPNTLHANATISTYNDHRMAMCFGMAQTVLPDLIIQNPDCVSKTYPQFWDDVATLNRSS